MGLYSVVADTLPAIEQVEHACHSPSYDRGHIELLVQTLVMVWGVVVLYYKQQW